MKLRKLRPGPIRELPVLTHNELVSEVEGLRRQVTELIDHRSPKSKSPVLVQLVWLGSSLLPPGRSVKLAAAAFDPTSVESAPFSGLAFFCTAFEESDQLDKYAIAIGPMAAATTADGTLSTRTDDDTGTLTMGGGHGIATGDTIVIQWAGGARYTVQVGTVAGNSVPIDGGRGDVLPAATTAVKVVRSGEIGYGIIPEAYWAKVNVTDPPNNKVRLFSPKAEGTGTDHFRVFELIERKYSVESAATVRWINHDLAPNEAEEPETIADPMNLFAGAAAGYEPWSSEFTRGMRGVAARWNDRPKSISGTLTTRTDDDTGTLTLSAMHGVMTGNTVDVCWGDDSEFSRLGMTVGTVSGTSVPIDGGTGDNLPASSTDVHVVNQSAVLGDPLWKIVAMEGFASWIKATVDFDDGEEIFQLESSSVKEDHGWNHIVPVSTGGIVPLANDTQIYDPYDGDKVLALLDDPDTDPPTYRVFRGQGKDRRAISGKAFGAVATGDPTFFIDNVVALDSGYNPTEGNTAALVTIVNVWAESYADNDDVWADFNKETGFWLARRKGGSGGGGVRLVRLIGLIDSATWNDAGEITPSINSKSELTVNPSTGETAIGSAMNVLWYGGAFTIPAGRERVGFAIPFKDHPELYVLIDPDCITFGEDD